MRRIAALVLFVLTLTSGNAAARALAPDEVPEPLKPWTNWVLFGEEERQCPFIHNDGTTHRCTWPSRLTLDLNNTGGAFGQEWQVYAESWVLLPGDTRHWPQNVKVNGEAVTVSDAQGRPRLRLPAGNYRIEGEFLWERLPESLAVTPSSGLIALDINGEAVGAPELDDAGQLWLRERNGGGEVREGGGEVLALQIFRRIMDTIPLQVTTRINLEVSGDQREVSLGPALLKDHIPLRLDSRLPARLEPDGTLRVQVRPGRWAIDLTSRHPGNVNEVPLTEAPAPWPAEEVWVFQAFNHLRLVEVVDLTSIDPRQTSLPPEWQNLPAYRMRPGNKLKLRVIRRGDPEPEPDRLSLERQLWLDFNGGGYTVQDSVTGSMTRGWRLEAQPPLELGRVSIDGQPQFITRRPGSERIGVEVRRGALSLSADSRLGGRVNDLPAVGWDTDVQSLTARLHLPPGWQLFSASGMDNAPDTWLQSWTLLDLFLVLIAAIAVQRLWGWRWGLVTLVTLALVWHEFAGMGPPRTIWLHILAAIGLLRVLPAGRIRKLVVAYRNVSLLILILVAIPFMVAEVRIAMYPQLAQTPYFADPLGVSGPVGGMGDESLLYEKTQPSMAAAPSPERLEHRARQMMDKAAGIQDSISQSRQLTQIDPNANVQTGPGTPVWQWRTVRFSWNGPVARDQHIGLVFLSPPTNAILNFVRVGLVAVLALLMLGFNCNARRGLYRQANWAWPLLLVPLLVTAPPPVLAAVPEGMTDLPEQPLLEELKNRLLAPPECLPACAEAPRLRLHVTEARLEARLEVHTHEAVAVPLPANARHWYPATVLVDGEPVTGLFRASAGGLYLRLPAGIHQVALAGPVPARDNFQMPLTLTPHRVEVEAIGWTVEGVHENGVPDAQLQFTRIRSESGSATTALEPSAMPTFVTVERVLRLDLDWLVESRVVRVSPTANAALLEVPLLPGESVLTEGVRTENGRVLVNMPPGQQEAFWLSSLEKTPKIVLTAPQTTTWTEVWRVDISPIWHLESTGLAVVHHQDTGGTWLPEWRPWPGERVELAVSRPEGVEGQTLTIDSTELAVSPGKRAADSTLTLALRSSQGGQHTLLLPENVSLQSVTIDGRAQPIRQNGVNVTFPLTPGRQTLTLTWRADEDIGTLLKTPLVDLNAPSVNNRIRLSLGQDRWTLFVGGPTLGPAVLFWSVLAIIVLVSFGLGRAPITPLRFRHWLLLGIGLSQVPLWMALVVVGWLLALGARGRWEPKVRGWLFDLMQVALVVLTGLALVYLFDAIQQGLLGSPEMQIEGNGSSAYAFNWYQDRSAAELPQAWVVSVPLLGYRLLMLAWALWLAFALLRWLRWGWGCFARFGLWQPLRTRVKEAGKARATSAAAESPASEA